MVKKEKKKKMMKEFDPPIKPRYLPGEIEEDLVRVDLKNYREHRLRCVNMKPKVDNKPPNFEIDIYYNQDKLNEEGERARMNYLENLDISRKIDTIFRMGGKVDCWNLKDKKLKIDDSEKERETRRIMIENKRVYNKVNSLSSEYSPQVMAKAWKTLRAQIVSKSKYPWFKTVPTYTPITRNAVAPTASEKVARSKCFFDLEFAQNQLPLGRLVFELYNDYVPLTCANFEAFCKGFNGLSYKGTPFHCILAGYLCQGGDVIKFNGLGGASIYDQPIADENFTLEHTCPGVLSTYGDNKNLCDSKYNLTLRPLRTMDGKKVVFGKVIKGRQTLEKVEGYGTKFGKPLRKIIVANCGILEVKNTSQRSSQALEQKMDS